MNGHERNGSQPVDADLADGPALEAGAEWPGPGGLDDLRELALQIAPQLEAHPIVALGWATIDLDAVRARIESDAGFGAFDPAPRDDHLGARAAVHRPGGDSGEPIEILLEPDTEGRLAASLARHGEGFAAIWFGQPAGAALDPPAGFGPLADGPLGPARLMLGGPPWALSVLLLELELR
jgi:hypothetical protein